MDRGVYRLWGPVKSTRRRSKGVAGSDRIRSERENARILDPENRTATGTRAAARSCFYLLPWLLHNPSFLFSLLAPGL